MIMKSDINKLVCILFMHLSSISLENFEDRSLISPEILELIKLHTYNFGLVYVKTKVQISCRVTAQLISTFVFTTLIVQSLYFLNPKFRASSHLLLLYRSVCVGPVGHCWKNICKSATI